MHPIIVAGLFTIDIERKKIHNVKPKRFDNTKYSSFDLTASFYLASLICGRSLECGQQPTSHVFFHWYFRYYLRILCVYVL